MAASKVYFTDFRTNVGTSLTVKMQKLIRRAGFDGIDMEGKFVAIKMHFGELGNLSYLRPNYAKALADLVKEKRVDGITELRDESSRAGMRICIELRKDVNPNVMLNTLYKHTQLQDTFGVIMLALVDNQPKVLNIVQMLKYYLKHQEDVVTRRTRYDLNKAEERAHILEGLLIAQDHIDEVISIIRGSATPAIAKQTLMERFGLSDAQAQAIIDMRLRALTGLEREKLQAEYDDLEKKIAYYNELLSSETLLKQVARVLAKNTQYATMISKPQMRIWRFIRVEPIIFFDIRSCQSTPKQVN